jgi:hypothetical protein
MGASRRRHPGPGGGGEAPDHDGDTGPATGRLARTHPPKLGRTPGTPGTPADGYHETETSGVLC